MKISPCSESRIDQIDFSNLVFGTKFSDHMLVAKYENGAWGEAEIKAYGNGNFAPAMHALHYGQAYFEGMKAYGGADGSVYLFRPERNFKRANLSGERLFMPEVPEEIFMGGLKKLIELDKEWVLRNRPNPLYIRPFMFSSEEIIAARASKEFHFMIITSPVMAYYPKPVRVKIEQEFSRSAPGGTGYAKAAGNYGGAFYPTHLAKEQGYDQIIWTDACTHQRIEESGTMNVMFIIDGKIITPKVSRTILDGVTRDSLTKFAPSLGYEVEVRDITVDEVVENLKSGRMTEAFGAGTAAVISPISHIGYKGTDYELYVGKDSEALKLKKALTEFQSGKGEDPWGWRMKLI